MANKSTYQQPEPWQQFSHPVVRDLAWVITSPALMSTRLDNFSALELDPDTTDACLEWLARLDQSSADSIPIDKRQFRRLGLYFEALVAFLFSQGRDDAVVPYRLLGRNIQVLEGNRTLGELDMLLEDRQGNCIHLECAVKFYLAHQPGIRDWQNWIGPNARDRLDIKLQRMLTHQLPLAKHATARPCLESREQNPRKVQSRYFLRGMFFPHSDSPECLPAHANQAALTGCWLHREKFASEDHHQWRALARLDWLTGSPSHQPRSKVVSPPEMLCRRTPEGRVEKRMLVDDYWPETNSPSRRI